MKLSSAILLSVIAHIGLLALLLANYQFSKIEVKPVGQARPQINAKAINSQRVEQLVEKLKQDKRNKKQQEVERLDKLKKAEEAAKQKRREEEQKANEARKRREEAETKRKIEEQKAEDLRKKRISDEKIRQEKIAAEKKRQAEVERKRKAEAERQRKAKAEAERKRKLKEAEEKKRKAKEAAERKRKAEEKAAQEALEREMQAQMDAEAAELEAAHNQQVLSEVAKFNKLIEDKIRRNWFKPENPGACLFRIGISPGGLVFNIETLQGDSAYCDSGKRAIRRAEPLPMSKEPDAIKVLKTRTFKLE